MNVIQCNDRNGPFLIESIHLGENSCYGNEYWLVPLVGLLVSSSSLFSHVLMFNPNDSIYFPGHSDNWQGSNGSFMDTSFDFLNNTTPRSFLSHMPLQPPQQVGRSYSESDTLNCDQNNHRSRNSQFSDSNRNAHSSYNRAQNSNSHYQSYRNLVPRWNPMEGRSSSNISQHYSTRSPSTSSNTTPSNQQSVSMASSSVRSRVVAINNPVVRSNSSHHSNILATSSTPTNITVSNRSTDTLQSKKLELEDEKRKLAGIMMEKQRITTRENECKKRIDKLTSEIKALGASVPPSNRLSHPPGRDPPIVFPSLSLKYNLPPNCDILASTTFIPQQGYRGHFKSPQNFGGGDPSLKILLRICNLNRDKVVQTDHINCKFEVIVNHSIVFAGKKKPHRGPLDITDTCVEGYQNNIEIKLVQSGPPAGYLEEPLPKEAVVQVVFAYKLETSSSIAALNLEKYQRAENDTIRLIKSKFSNECGILDDSDVKVSLTCQVLFITYFNFY